MTARRDRSFDALFSVIQQIAHTMDTRLLELLVCPLCKGAVRHDREARLLICEADKLAFPVRDGIPVMLESEARAWPEVSDLAAHPDAG